MGNDIFGITKYPVNDGFSLGSPGGLRGGFNDFVGDHPNWMVYVRRDMKYPSPTAYDPHNNSPNTSDQESFGLGYKIQYEKHAVRRVVKATDASAPIESFGYLAQFHTVIYTPRYCYPKKKDLYIEVEWNVRWEDVEVYGKPIKIVNAFQVDDAISFREDEVTYMACACNEYNFTLENEDAWLKVLGQVWTDKRVI